MGADAVIRIVCGGLEPDVAGRCRIPTGALFSGNADRDIWNRRSVPPVELSRDGSADVRLTIPEEEAFSLVCACLAILLFRHHYNGQDVIDSRRLCGRCKVRGESLAGGECVANCCDLPRYTVNRADKLRTSIDNVVSLRRLCTLRTE
jgi:hypothetical protein